MSNIKLFKALSCQMRINILKIIMQKEIHISGIAKELGISKPVVCRHIKILEEADLIEKKIIGNIHLLNVKFKNIEKCLESFVSKSSIKIYNKNSLFDALKQIPEIKIKKIKNNYYIEAINDEEGFYIYDVNGVIPSKPINKYKLNKNVTINLKKLVSISKKEIKINLKKNYKQGKF